MATLGLGVLVVTFAVLYTVIKVPAPNDAALAQSTVVYYSDGTTVLGRIGTANRSTVLLSQVPDSLQKAVLSAEDRQFYDHGGFSVTGIARAAANDLTGGSQQGGSTITQQLVKNYYLTQDRTVSRKITEFFVSIKIERELSKDQILEDYLNTIYFGRGAYGVQAAAHAYFGVDVSKLTPPQSAVLAAIIASPGGFAPETHLAKLKDRWGYVVDGMVSQGWLTPAQRAALRFPAIAPRQRSVGNSGPAGYLLQYAQSELTAARGYSEEDLGRLGLRVVTTFSKTAEDQAVAAVNAKRPTTNAAGVRVGLASVDPGTGRILAMYGGPDYGHPQFVNDATQSTAQAGSTFKAFTLAAALESGVSLSSMWDGTSGRVFTDVNGVKTKPIPNEDGGSYGMISLNDAMARSVNTVFVDVENQPQVGAAKVVDAARRAGIPDNVRIDAGLSATLGVASPTVLDMASAYATFAAGGLRNQPTSILKVLGNNGATVYQHTPTPTRVMTADIAAQVTQALQHVVQAPFGTGTKAQAVGRPVAAKTGTTDSNLSAWFVGYTPQIATAVAMFRPSADGRTNLSMNGVGGLARVNGGSFPASIWTAYMIGAVTGLPVVQFPTPSASPSPTPSVSTTPSPTPSVSRTPSPTSSAVSPSPSTFGTTSPSPSGTTSPSASAVVPAPPSIAAASP
jgi:membrane peptidoglycan carboxypeptidase